MEPVCQFNRGYGINDELDAPPPPPPPAPPSTDDASEDEDDDIEFTQRKVTVMMVSRMRQGSIATMNRS